MRQFLLGLIIIGLGFSLVYFSSDLSESFGRIDILENYLGSTRGGYMIFGTGIMLIGFLIMFGILSPESTNEVSQLDLG